MTRLYSSISVETTLASTISNSATTMTVAAGTGTALLGGVTLAAGNVDQFTVALDPDTANEEIVFITDPGKPGLVQIPAGVWSVDAWLSETGGGANHASFFA